MEDQLRYTLDFLSPEVSDTTTRLLLRLQKAATDNPSVNSMAVSNKFHLQKQWLSLWVRVWEILPHTVVFEWAGALVGLLLYLKCSVHCR